MPRSRQLTQTIRFYYYFFLYPSGFTYTVWLPVVCVYEIPKCAKEYISACVSKSVSASCTFSWAVFLLFVLSCSFILVLSYFVIAPQMSVSFLRRPRKCVALDGRRGGEKLEGVEGRETIVRIHYKGKYIYN